MDFTQESDNQDIHSKRNSKKVYDIIYTYLYTHMLQEGRKGKREKKGAVCQSVRVMYRGSPNHYTDSGLNRPRK